MKSAQQIYERLVPVVAAINRVIEIDNVVDNGGDSYTIETCNTLWATVGYTVDIDGTDYLITDIVPDESITVTGPDPIEVSAFILYPFFFVHGKLRPLDNEIGRIISAEEKFPMLWLHDITNENHNTDPESNVGIIAECDMYALVNANKEQLLKIVDHDRYAIRPMRNLLKAFINALQASGITLLNRTTDTANYTHTMRDDALFGQYFNSNNNSSNNAKFFGDDTSGTHLRITIPFKKYACDHGECADPPAFGGVIIKVDGVFQEVAPSNTTYDFESGGTFVYDLYVNGVDTGQDITVDGTDITLNLE